MEKLNVVICGAGVMGASLAQVYALAGHETWLYNHSASGLERGKKLIELNQRSMVSEQLVTEQGSAEALKRIHYTLETDAFTDCDLVVECIPEELELKQAFFRRISPMVPDSALLASNTSGLSITQIAAAVEKPGRFMGQHWLNPPHLLPLCEIIVGEKTDEDQVRRMRGLVEGLGKYPIIVKDVPGFIINRLQFSLLREALHIVESGIASAEDVDMAMKAGMGLRYAALGPFGIADFGGLDTFEHINDYLNAQLCSARTGSALLHDMVEKGMLGVKSGRGFYDYSGDRAELAIAERDRKYIELAKLLYFRSGEDRGS